MCGGLLYSLEIDQESGISLANRSRRTLRVLFASCQKRYERTRKNVSTPSRNGPIERNGKTAEVSPYPASQSANTAMHAAMPLKPSSFVVEIFSFGPMVMIW